MKIWTNNRSNNVHTQRTPRWKALAEIYTMHSFAPFWKRIPKNEENRGGVSNLNFFVKIAEFVADFLQNLPEFC